MIENDTWLNDPTPCGVAPAFLQIIDKKDDSATAQGGAAFLPYIGGAPPRHLAEAKSGRDNKNAEQRCIA